MQVRTSRAWGILILANTPRSVFSPAPVFALSLFFLYQHPMTAGYSALAACASGVAFSMLSLGGANIWNHVNDMDEDRAANRDSPLLKGHVGVRGASAVTLVFYTAAVAVTALYATSRGAVVLAIASCLATFLYYWKRLRPLGGLRLKEHWTGEILVYAVAISTHTLALAAIYAPLDAHSLVIALPLFAYLFCGLVLKDLKDISSDAAAGYRTLGIVFPVATLLSAAFFLLFVFYFGAMAIAAAGIVGRGGIFVVVCAIAFLVGVAIPIYRRKWELTADDGPRVSLLAKSTYIAPMVWGLGSVFG